jgi:hypothetical protein
MKTGFCKKRRKKPNGETQRGLPARDYFSEGRS